MGLFDNFAKASQKAASGLRKWEDKAPAATPRSQGTGARWNDSAKPFDPRAVMPQMDWEKGYRSQGDIAKENREEYVKQERQDRLGVDTLSDPGYSGAPKIKQLSQKDYDALSPEQRAAVDFNTMLIKAVESDKANQEGYEKVGGQARATYDVAVEEAFGKDRGSDIYAPETMAVLQQLKLDNTVTDLDDYLDLKLAITEDDLKLLIPKKEGPLVELDEGLTDVGHFENRNEFQMEIAERTSALAETLAKGNKMLADFSTSAALARGSDRVKFGGAAPVDELPLGFGTSELDKYFGEAFVELATNPKFADETLGTLRQSLKPKELDAFWNYADQRSRSAQQYGTPLGSEDELFEKGDKYTTPQEFRKLLGLEG